MATHHGLPVGLLACPPDPPGVAWIRILAISSGYDVQEVWQVMWRTTLPTFEERGVQQAAALSIPPWLPKVLKGSGFTQNDTVRFLEWSKSKAPPEPEIELPVEPLLSTNLTAVAEIDRRAFAPLWRHSLEALQSALNHANYATVLRQDGKAVGYQISTASQYGGHLARLAVDPGFQGKGLASYLVVDALRYFHHHGHDRVTVNTQGSNGRSLALYKRLGFHSLDQEFPVYSLSPGMAGGS
jgi:ribosomal protein S18 acetylase RimI-like enzyme